jgi:phage baseplate assembly protein W
MKQADPEKSFLGKGCAFPPGIEPSGKLSTAAFEEDIRQAIMIIIGTAPGERVMRPDFGAGLKELVFEPVNTTTLALVRHRVERALIDWEPRIDVEEVKVTTDPGEPNKLLIDVTYRIRVTNSVHNLVYPFYLLEGQRS